MYKKEVLKNYLLEAIRITNNNNIGINIGEYDHYDRNEENYSEGIIDKKSYFEIKRTITNCMAYNPDEKFINYITKVLLEKLNKQDLEENKLYSLKFLMISALYYLVQEKQTDKSIYLLRKHVFFIEECNLISENIFIKREGNTLILCEKHENKNTKSFSVKIK